jgi:hypothetical protein
MVIASLILSQFRSSSCSTPTCHHFRNTPAATRSRKRSSAVDVGCRPVVFNAVHGLPVRRTETMASAQRRSDTCGQPPPNLRAFTGCDGRGSSSTAHRSSEMRTPVVVVLFGVRARVHLDVGSGRISSGYQFFGSALITGVARCGVVWHPVLSLQCDTSGSTCNCKTGRNLLCMYDLLSLCGYSPW